MLIASDDDDSADTHCNDTQTLIATHSTQRVKILSEKMKAVLGCLEVESALKVFV